MKEYVFRKYINEGANTVGVREMVVPNNIVEQIKADAIEEFFKMLESVSFGNRKGLVHWKDIVSIREQLKEQK